MWNLTKIKYHFDNCEIANRLVLGWSLVVSSQGMSCADVLVVEKRGRNVADWAQKVVR